MSPLAPSQQEADEPPTAVSGAAEASEQPKRASRWLNLAVRPGGLALIAGFCALVLLLYPGFTVASKTETLRGYVASAASLSQVMASAGGTVKQVHIRTGQTVAAGQALFMIQPQAGAGGGAPVSDPGHSALRERRLVAVESRKAAQTAIEAAAQDDAQVAATMATVVKEVDLQERELQGALSRQQELVKKARQYLASGYATRDAVLAQEKTAFDYSRQLLDGRIKKAELLHQAGERGRAQQALAQQRQAQITTLDGEIAGIDAKLSQPRSAGLQEVTAPIAGRVEAVFAEPGAAITANQLVALLADPKTEASIVLEAPAVDAIKIGQRVRIRYDGGAARGVQSVGGTVTAIAVTPSRSIAANGPQAIFRVEVKPEQPFMLAAGRPEAIVPYATLVADLVAQRRALDWPLDPFGLSKEKP